MFALTTRKTLLILKSVPGHGIPSLLYGHVFKGVFKLFTVRIFSCVIIKFVQRVDLLRCRKPELDRGGEKEGQVG